LFLQEKSDNSKINRKKRAARGSSGNKIRGVIKKVDEVAKSVVVTTKGGVFTEGKEMTFPIENTTKITKGKKEIPFTELKEGMNVSVSYIMRANRMIVTAINVYTPRGGVPKILKRVRAKSE